MIEVDLLCWTSRVLEVDRARDYRDLHSLIDMLPKVAHGQGDVSCLTCRALK